MRFITSKKIQSTEGRNRTHGNIKYIYLYIFVFDIYIYIYKYICICKINLLTHCHSLDNIGNKANELADITTENMKMKIQAAGKLFDKIRY